METTMADEKKINFTDERLRKIQLPDAGKRAYYYDTTTPGLRLAVSATGNKSFQYQAWSSEKQRPVTITLGKWPSMPINAARDKAVTLQDSVNDGGDPELDKKQKRDTLTVAELLDQYLEDHSKPLKRSWRDDETRIKLYLKPAFGRMLITELTDTKIIPWMNKTKNAFSGSTANRRLALLSVAYTTVVKTFNPCKGIKRFKETPQERYLRSDELARLFTALDELRNEGDIDNTDYVELSLLTGARQANVLAMRWNDLDLNFNQWRVPGEQSKNGKVLTVALSADAIAILERRKETASSVFVFPGIGKSGHLQEPFKGWQRILKRADITECRLHDLRHTLASYQSMSGTPESVIGKTLGHQSIETTRKYTHMMQETVLASVEKAIELMKAPVEKKVVNITGGK
jgi:integrase